MGGRGSSSGAWRRLRGITEQQKAQMDKFVKRFSVGSDGLLHFGGTYATITKAPTFTVLKNGDVKYEITGERVLPYQKSYVIGVGDTPERLREIKSSGTINKYGQIMYNKNAVTERVVEKNKRKKR